MQTRTKQWLFLIVLVATAVAWVVMTIVIINYLPTWMFVTYIVLDVLLVFFTEYGRRINRKINPDLQPTTVA